MDPVQLPYYAPPEELPCPIPTKEAIESSDEILSKRCHHALVGVGPQFVVQYGTDTRLEDGLNMIFVRKNTAVPVPKVYALFEDPDTKIRYIVMERSKGTSLDKVWTSLGTSEKETIARQLKASLDEMRQLPSPGGFCSLNRRQLRNYWLNLYTGCSWEDAVLGGPYETEEHFNEALLAKYAACGAYQPGREAMFRLALDEVFHGHAPTFTHGDLNMENIWWDKDTRSITIIDWGFAGWYPTYWEHVIALFWAYKLDRDWFNCLEQCMPVFWTEYAWMQMLLYELLA